LTVSPSQQLLALAPKERLTIALSEGSEPRTVVAALAAIEAGLADIILVGSETEVLAELAKNNAAPSETLVIHDPALSDLHEEFAKSFFELRKHKGVTEEAAHEAMRNPLAYAAMLVRKGLAHGTVGGAVAATADIIRPALQIIGKSKDAPLVSSFFLMLPPQEALQGARAMLYADCGLVVDPSAEDQVGIAVSTAASAKALLSEPAKIAMLSFSTMGSAKHPMVDKVVQATETLKRDHPELDVDGDLQFDAAFVPDTGKRKAPESPVAGQANVMIFPSLDAGNIAYKITQRIGGYTAIGPILQGLAQPANDLSRGCTSNDIVEIIAVTVLQALNQKQNNHE
jgi:phosphate acetyltransferase